MILNTAVANCISILTIKKIFPICKQVKKQLYYKDHTMKIHFQVRSYICIFSIFLLSSLLVIN